MMNVDLQPDTTYVVVASPSVVTMRFDDLTDFLRRAVAVDAEGIQQ